MNKLLTSLLLLFACACACAQVPQKMTYQSVVRDANNSLVDNRNVSARIWILHGGADGTAVYIETQTATTNANGLMTLVIGEGTVVSGNLAAIVWADGPYFLKAEVDPAGGSSYTQVTVQELLSVPYALYAEQAGNGFGGDYNDLVNTPAIPTVPTHVSAFTNDAGYLTSFTEQQVLSISHDTVFLTGGSFVKLPAGFDGNYNSLTNRPNLSAVATSGSYSDLTGTPNIPTVPTNVSTFTNDAGYLTSFTEQQVLSIRHDTLFLTGGSFVKLSAGFDGAYNYNSLTNRPNLSAVATSGSYSDLSGTPTIPTVPTNVSAFTNDAGYLTSFTEQQVLTIRHDTLFLTGGSFVKLPAGFDGSYNYNSLTDKPNLSAVATSGSYSDLTGTPDIPTVPTSVSAFTNDAGYLTPATVQEAVTIPTNVSAYTNDAGYLTVATAQDEVAVPTAVSEFSNDAGYITAGQVPAQVSADWNATEGAAQILNKPEIPTEANNATLTIQQNGATIGTFTGNASSDQFLNVTVPTATSQLSNNAGYITADSLPTNVSAFVNDAGYLTAAQCGDTSLCEMVNLIASLQTQIGQVQTAIAQMDVLLDSLEEAKFRCGTSLVFDYDSNLYHTLQLGNQCWMKENMRTTHFADGTEIPASQYMSSNQMRRYIPNNDTNLIPTYGYMYNWVAAMHNTPSSSSNPSGVQGVCPTGWHVPSHDEWMQLADFVGGQPQYFCGSNYTNIAKALASTTGWDASDELCAVGNASNGNNASGFSAYPSGYYFNNQRFFGSRAFFLSSTQNDYGRVQGFCIVAGSSAVGTETTYLPSEAYAVRCLRDVMGANALLPTVSTTDVSSISLTTATCGGEVTADGGAEVTARGVCWSTIPEPTVNDAHTTDGTGTGTFTSELTGLSPSTYYYVRAYATNSYGTRYGQLQSFTTPAFTLPTVVTVPASDITYTSATCGGEVTSEGDAPVTERGICWTTNGYPTADGNHIVVGGGLGSFTATITGLVPGTSYHVCAYAISDAGTVYGGLFLVVTQSLSLPDVYTASVSNITLTTATCGGEVTSDGGAEVTARGVCWSTSPSPTLNDAHTTDGSGTGTFTSELTGLSPNTFYYVRTYATNSQGTRYGQQQGFTTTALSLPTVVTASASDITYTSATCGGEVTSEGDAPVTERGVCWGTNVYPTVNDNRISVGSGLGSFTATITDLVPGTHYYVRAYAISDAGTMYGGLSSFVTQSLSLPSVYTASVSDITSTTATCGGEVTADGGAEVTERGVCWSTSPIPTVNDAHTTDGSGTGTFTSELTGLSPVTIYYVRAYATNSQGTRYGPQQSFTTTALSLPTVVTFPASDVTNTSATCGGEVTSEGDAPVTARGVCWSTYPIPTVYDMHTTDGTGTGTFTSELTGLSPGTTYYVRAYATNSVGTAYGEQQIFTTTPMYTLPGIIIGTISNVTHTSANCSARVVDNGHLTVTASGVCWSATNLTPTLDDNYTTDGASFGEFTSTITGLTAGTIYYVRAYVTNSMGTSYSSSTLVFTTPVYAKPTVTTNPIDSSGITSTTVICGGNVTDEGDAPVTERGICWSDSTSYPTLADNYIVEGGGPGSFTVVLTDLIHGHFYFVRAFATNSYGTVYGEVRRYFVPQLYLPQVYLLSVYDITATSAFTNSYCSIDETHNLPVLARGVCWSTSPHPTLSDNQTSFATGGSGYYHNQITNLMPDTTYYIRAYATNAHGTMYSNEWSVNTLELTMPAIVFSNISHITCYSATCEGEVTDDGNDIFAARGFCWSTSPNPTLDGNHTVGGEGIGEFSHTLTGLSPNTTYYVRAYVTNSLGTAYGEEMNFTTNDLSLPTVTTNQPINIHYSRATCVGVVLDENCAPVTARGICWSTSSNPTIDGNHTVDGAGMGEFSHTFTGLTSSTTYHVRAYATTSLGTSYGEDVVFATYDSIPCDELTIPYSCSFTNSGENLCWTTVDANDDGNTFAINHEEGRASFYAYHACPADDYLVSPTFSFNGNPIAVSYTARNSGFDYKIYKVLAVGADTVTLLQSDTLKSYITLDRIVDASMLNGDYSIAFCCDTDVYLGFLSFTQFSIYYDYPTVVTEPVTQITDFTAQCNGDLTSGGGNTVFGFCWSTSPNPTIESNRVVATLDPNSTHHFSYTLTGLTLGTHYYVRAYAFSVLDTVYGIQREFTTTTLTLDGLPCPGTPTVTDVDNNTYNTLWLGNLCWMKENLRTTRYADNTPINLGGNNVSLTTAYRYCPNNNSNNVSTYGYLYNMAAVRRGASSSSSIPSGVQGVCPNGWHVPSGSEWEQLSNYLISNSQQYACYDANSYYWQANIAKALASTTGWHNPFDPEDLSHCAPAYNPSSNNVTNFTARPAGRRYPNDTFNSPCVEFGETAYFWSCSIRGVDNWTTMTISGTSPEIFLTWEDAKTGCSVRCVRD